MREESDCCFILCYNSKDWWFLELGKWRLLSRTTGVETRKGRLMKLLYTDMSQDLTEILTEQATSYAQKGKRIFYIAPNALSFEKERKVLEYLPQRPLRLR